MMFLLRMLMRRGRGPAMDPLQVSMTGVRMGERFLQVGCNDRALLAGLAAKVGLSGTAVVAAFTASEAKLAESIARKVGALIDIKDIDEGRAWPIDDGAFDLVVVDDTAEGFVDLDQPLDVLRNTRRALRAGGRIEVVTPVKNAHPPLDFEKLLAEAGYKPVRILAETNGLRFVEGLRTA
ncbi:MAG TPA: class I SAM-dependent methyltransferase [Vicinamibacterales bacterium]